MELKISEKEAQKSILDYLSMRCIFAWRNNSGKMPYSSKGKDYMVQMGPTGSPDIIGILPDGKFLGIEVKGTGGVVSSSQTIFLDHINKLGGLAFVAYSIDDVVKHFKANGY